MTKIRNGYGIGQPLQDIFPSPIIGLKAPTASNTYHEIGQLWIVKNGALSSIYILSNVSSGSATWTLIGAGEGGSLDHLTADSGGELNPVNSNIDILGGTNITTVGTSGTITFNLDDAITVDTSVTTPLVTAPAGGDLTVQSPTGQDVNISSPENILLDSSGSAANAIQLEALSGGVSIGTGSAGISTSGGNVALTTAGTTLSVKGGGGAAFIGTGTLVSGVGFIANTSITANDRIILIRIDRNSSSAIGDFLYAITPGTGANILSVQRADPSMTETNDNSTYMFFIVRQT